MKNRTDVISVAVGNGGLGALAWADYIKTQTNAKVRVLVDAGIWENDINEKTNDNYFKKRMKTLNKVFVNSGYFPNSKCQAVNPENIKKCFTLQKL
jgi:hypothetical protein